MTRSLIRKFIDRRLRGTIIALAVGSILFSLGEATAQPAGKPPYDVRQERSRYDQQLADAEAELMKRYPLSYDDDGNVIVDANQRAAEREFLEIESRQRQQAKGNTRRDRELDSVFQDAGVRHDDWSDTGTPPHDAEYRGFHSDRDVTARSTGQVNDIAASAERRGYTVERKNGYVRIKELDVVVWDPQHIQVKTGWRITEVDPNRSFRDQVEAINQDLREGRKVDVQGKGRSLTQQIEDLHEPEFVVGHDKPGVAQQVKKSESRFRGDAPDGLRDQAEFTQELAKSAHKATKTVDPDGIQGIVSDHRRQLYKDLKAGAHPAGRVYRFGERPEKKKGALRRFRDESVAETLRDALAADQARRNRTITQLEDQCDVLRNKLRESKMSNDFAQRVRCERELKAADQRLKRLYETRTAEDLTLKVTEKKNPRLKTRVIDPSRPPGKNQRYKPLTAGKLARASTLAKYGGVFTAVYQEYQDALAEDRELSQARMSWLAFKNLSGITQVQVSYEQAQHELGEGMKIAAVAEAERLRKLGLDPNDPAVQELIWRRVVLRATVRASWHGSKAIPLLGDVVQGVEDTFQLTESTVGLVHDTMQKNQILEMNRVQQSENQQQALALAQQMESVMKRQLQAAGELTELAKKLADSAAEAERSAEETRENFRYQLNALEALQGIALENEGQTSPPLDGGTITDTVNEIDAITTEERKIVRECEQTIDSYRAGNQPMDDIEGRKQELTARQQQLDGRYARVSGILETLRQADDTQESHRELVELHQDTTNAQATLDTAARLLTSLADRLQDTARRYAAVERGFQDQKSRLLRLTGYFDEHGRSNEEAAKLRAIRQRAISYQINPAGVELHVKRVADMRLLAKRLDLVARNAEIPEPAGSEMEPVENEPFSNGELLTRLTPSLGALDDAIAMAREKLEELRGLAPLEPPHFEIVSRHLSPESVRFEVCGERLPDGGQIFYSWDFGDGQGGGPPESVRTHEYAQSGRYNVSVSVFQTRGDFSGEIGKAAVSVQVESAMTQPPAPSGDSGFRINTWIYNKTVDINSITQLDVANTPVDQGDHVWLTIDPRSGAAEVKVTVSQEWFLENNNGVGWNYWLTQVGQGTGRVDLATGRFDMTYQIREFDERPARDGSAIFGHFEPSSGPYGGLHVYPRGRAGAHAIIGFTPQVGLSGRVTGQTDMVGSGGTASVTAPLMSPRNWSYAPRDFVRIQPPEWVDQQRSQYDGIAALDLLLYANEAAARSHLAKHRAAGSMDLGDASSWDTSVRYRGTARVRIGRIVIVLSVGRIGTQDDARQILERLLEFLETSGAADFARAAPGR